jgi:hypothetical protein
MLLAQPVQLYPLLNHKAGKPGKAYIQFAASNRQPSEKWTMDKPIPAPKS